jgi:uncharacterized protein with von Willebrand factor type A (vWA) domain
MSSAMESLDKLKELSIEQPTQDERQPAGTPSAIGHLSVLPVGK